MPGSATFKTPDQRTFGETRPSTARIADVAVALPMRKVFSYMIPDSLSDLAKIGVRARVPFRNTEKIGFIVKIRDRNDADNKAKPLSEILDEIPLLSESMLRITEWMSLRYACSWGEAIENALPRWVKFGSKAGAALKKSEKNQLPASPSVETLKTFDKTLTKEQAAAFELIGRKLDEKNPKPLLIHGITGSGKTELYIRAIKETLKKNRTAICLVPEIALTEQIRLFFLEHLGDQLEIIHSKLTDGEKFLAWKRIEHGQKLIVLGPRSAIFAPVPRLGLVIIDEEHETTYKQETSPRYHAREVALQRTLIEHALLIVGSATPSLETNYESDTGRYDKVQMRHRVDHRPLPNVRILDLKDSTRGEKKPQIFSHVLCREVEQNLKKKESTILLLNRRGFSTRIHCPKCAHVENCPSCQIALTFHQEKNQLVCHYCNFLKPPPDQCSQCKNTLMKFAGFGTEKLESEASRLFPGASIARLDTDVLKKRGAHESILRDFREHKIDILIGTQMVAKGFDFPNVTLVGIVLADVGLMLPDFRSAERTFQLLTQVAGRAGRGNLPGRVFIQTYSPDHPSIVYAREHHYENFCRYELEQRREYHYPPFVRIVNIIIRGLVENKAYLAARAVKEALQAACAEKMLSGPNIQLLGPAPLPFYHLRGNFRWHVLIKHQLEDAALGDLLSTLDSIKKSAGVMTAVDVDPVNIL